MIALIPKEEAVQYLVSPYLLCIARKQLSDSFEAYY